jgi:hypothetical protein
LTQLDCGFRPSEFVDLNYGDVEVRTGLALFHIRDGKTGSRTVIAHRCVPALLKWLDAHPTKKAEDPLWVQESTLRSDANGRFKIRRYEYAAMSKRLRETARRVGIAKPMDFYCLRHSSCVLDKIENLPVDLAAERHGHSVKHFVGTYGRLSLQDVVRRYQTHYGQDAGDKKPVLQHRDCPTCKATNESSSKWCAQCGTPFSTEGAIRSVESAHADDQNSRMEAELNALRKELTASRERESQFHAQQMDLLLEMQEIRRVVAVEKSGLQKEY